MTISPEVEPVDVPHGGADDAILQILLGKEPRVLFIDFPEPSEFSDADLALLQKLRSVPGLSLQNTKVTTRGIAAITDCRTDRHRCFEFGQVRLLGWQHWLAYGTSSAHQVSLPAPPRPSLGR